MKKRKLLFAVLISSMLLSSSAFSAENEYQSSIPQFMNGFAPTPIVGELDSGCWGADTVGPRDQSNGLEDRELERYSYRDGGIIKDEETGKYYMFASRWEQAEVDWGEYGTTAAHESKAIYAVSDNLYGPYEDKGLLWPDFYEGAGENVFPFKVSTEDPLYEEGYRYAIVTCGVEVGGYREQRIIHVSKSLEGPWELVENDNDGEMILPHSWYGYSQFSIIVRPDGLYEAADDHGQILIAESLAGAWRLERGPIWRSDYLMPYTGSDTVLWYANYTYHIIMLNPSQDMAFYATSADGLDWTRARGVAYREDIPFITYEDGTVNAWAELDRPNVYLEDGKLVAMIFSVTDVEKQYDQGDDMHGSKIIVSAYDSTALLYIESASEAMSRYTGDFQTDIESDEDSEGNRIFTIAVLVAGVVFAVVVAAILISYIRVLVAMYIKKKK